MSLAELSTHPHAVYCREQRRARVASGRCRDCDMPAVDGVRCKLHGRVRKAQNKAYRARIRARRDEARARVREVQI